MTLSHIKNVSEKIFWIIRSHKIRSTFCTKNRLRKLPCESKDHVTAEQKNDVIYEIERNNCQVVVSWTQKLIEIKIHGHKRSVKNSGIGKNEIKWGTGTHSKMKIVLKRSNAVIFCFYNSFVSIFILALRNCGKVDENGNNKRTFPPRFSAGFFQ